MNGVPELGHRSLPSVMVELPPEEPETWLETAWKVAGISFAGLAFGWFLGYISSQQE